MPNKEQFMASISTCGTPCLARSPLLSQGGQLVVQQPILLLYIT